jgi:metallo-beta-lactamase class B
MLRTLLLLSLGGAASAATLVPDPPNNCDDCAAWAAPREPFRVYGNTYYVGDGLSSILITSKEGHILLDGGLTQSAATIASNIQKLGFKLEDVKLILNSHTHSDHAGGIAALQRASAAQVAASSAAKRALEGGGATADDPQFAFGPAHTEFPKVENVRVVKDGETLRVGKLEITAHFTPGHTPGGTSWSWRSCESRRCLDVVYADSLSPISAPGFRFTGDGNQPSRVAEFVKSITVVQNLRCDILLAPHPELIDMSEKLASWKQAPAVNPFIEPTACESYATSARERLASRVMKETGP